MLSGSSSSGTQRKRRNSMQKKCATKHCRNKAAPKKRFCHKCRKRKAKANNPGYYFFNALQNNARRRGIAFNLTRQEFDKFCQKTGYLEKKGQNGTDLTIDRKDHRRGYEYDNLQVMTHALNSLKGYYESQDAPF